VFLLREEGGLSFKEIAEMTGCPLNTALGRMHYAMEALRKSLKAYGMQ
jgi:RNA polymerase sigma-70 factor (ECF subfamily)